MNNNPAIELKGISKAFGPVQANKDITIKVMPGSIHGVIGENGAGKSTFLKVLSGEIQPNSGSVIIEPGNRLSILEQNQNACYNFQMKVFNIFV